MQYFIGIQVIAILLQLRYANVALQAFHTTRAMWYKERNHRLYLGFDAFVAQLFNEICLSVIIACLLYLSLWVPVGWGYFEPGRLLKALMLSCCLQQVRSAPSSAWRPSLNSEFTGNEHVGHSLTPLRRLPPADCLGHRGGVRMSSR